MSQDQPDFAVPTLGPLSKNSRLCWRSILSNNGDTPLWSTSAYPNYNGKFFPRQCRGYISTIDVYCRDAAAAGGTLTVYISPFPYLGQTYNANIVVPVSGVAAWRSATFNITWSYDSLFIWVRCSVAAIQIAYNIDVNGDCFYSANDGVTWVRYNGNYWYQVNYFGETAGDVPVSGTISTILIPNQSSGRLYVTVTLTTNNETLIKSVDGAGENDYLDLWVNAIADSHLVIWRIYCDGVLSFQWDFQGFSQHFYTASTPKMSLLKYGADATCCVLITLKLPFRQNFTITAQHTAGASQPYVILEGLLNLLR